MKKVKGKALSLVLSLALVISSFSAIPASAATKTLTGSLDNIDDTEFYLVNGGSDAALVYEGFGSAVSADPTLETPDHKPVSDVHIAAISHKSGDRLVKWYDSGSDGKQDDSISTDTEDANIDLALRSSTVSGTETLSILYKGTYTDDDDNEYTVKSEPKDVTIRVYNKGETVIGEYGDIGEHTADNGVKGELDSTFAQKTYAHEKDPDTTTNTDSKQLIVLKATADTTNPVVVAWDSLKTVAYDKDKEASDSYDADAYYVLKVTGNNVVLNDGVSAGTTTYDYVVSDGSVPDDGAGTTTYDVTSGAPADDDSPTVAEGSDGKLTVTKAVSDTGDDWTYNYKLNADKALSTDDAVTAGTADAISLAPDTTKVAVTAFDSTGTEKGTTVVTVVATTTGAVDSKDYAPISQNAASKNKLDVAKAGNDTDSANAWTYKYSIGAAVTKGATEFTPGEGVITVPATAGTVKVAVTAFAKDGTEKGTTVATVVVTGTTTGDNEPLVTAQVASKANTGNLTFTAEATDKAKDEADALDLNSTSDIKAKSSVTKTIKVKTSDDVADFSKYSTSTYLFKGSVDKDNYKDAIKVTGYEVNFDAAGADVKVDDKASVTKISGKVKSVTVSEGSVGSISLSNNGDSNGPSVTVSDAKVGDVDFGSHGGILDVNSTDASVGNVTDATTVKVTNGTVGNISATTAEISAEDEDGTVKVGDVTASTISVDSDNSKVATGTLKATSDETEITLTGDFVTVAGVDFDNYGAELKLDGFNGTIPAPENATEDGATISTNATDDKVTIDGNADINSISIGDDGQMTFNGKLNVGSVDGSGTLVVGLGQMNISSDASGVILKFSNPTINVGDTAFTAVTDTVDVDSMEPYGCTLSVSEGSKEDTFKIASTEFVGLTFNPASARIANGYSENFSASAYAPGSALPDGYKIQYTLDGDDDIFQMTNNDDGTVTVKVVGYDDTFAEENTATLRAEVVDTDGDIDDDYSAGELDLTALAVPDATFKSDTGSTLSIGGGFTYQFAITSLDNSVPYFAVAGSSFKTTYVGNSGNTYYYKVTAVGKVGDAAGVYINHEAKPSTVITITNPSDTAAVTVKAGGSYQFRVNGPSQPVFQVAGIGNIALTSKAGSNYYFKVNVPTNLAKGGHGVYNNGVLVAILTVA